MPSRIDKTSIEVGCPGGHTLRVKRKYAGMTGACPRCGATITVPEAPCVDEAFLDNVLSDAHAHDTSDDAEHVLHQELLESSGVSLVGKNSIDREGPINTCPKCHRKVHVPKNNVCPACGAYFTHWH